MVIVEVKTHPSDPNDKHLHILLCTNLGYTPRRGDIRFHKVVGQYHIKKKACTMYVFRLSLYYHSAMTVWQMKNDSTVGII